MKSECCNSRRKCRFECRNVMSSAYSAVIGTMQYIIESCDKSKLYVPYMYYFLDKYVETLRKLSIGGVIKYIKLGNLTDAEIPIPELSIQKKIVFNLDKVTHTIDTCNAILEKLDLLVKSRFIELFGDTGLNP